MEIGCVVLFLSGAKRGKDKGKWWEYKGKYEFAALKI